MEAAVRSACPGGVDGLIDAALIGNRAAALVRDGGATVSLRRSHPITDPRLHHHYLQVFDQATNTAALTWLADRLRDGVLTPRIALRLHFSAAAEAHRRVEQGGHQGRVMLMPALGASGEHT
jgi:NADPH:quinone reductase-like Zn-dependent oxidoreductase